MWSASRVRGPAVCSSSSWDRLGHLPMYTNRRAQYHKFPSSVNPPPDNFAENRLQKPSLLSSNNGGELFDTTVSREHPQLQTRRYTSRSRLPTRPRIQPVFNSERVAVDYGNEAAKADTFFEALSKSTDTPYNVIDKLKYELVNSIGDVDPLKSVLKDKTYPQEIDELTEHIYEKTVSVEKQEDTSSRISPYSDSHASHSSLLSRSNSKFLHPPESRLGLTERDHLLLHCPLAGSPGIRGTNHECLNTYRISRVRDFRFGLRRQGDVTQISPHTNTNFGVHATVPLADLKPSYIQWLLNRNMLYRKPRLRFVLALMGRIEGLLSYEYPYFRPCPLRTINQMTPSKFASRGSSDGAPLGAPIPSESKTKSKKSSNILIKRTREKLWDVMNLYYPIRSPLRVTDGELSTPDEAFAGPKNVRVAPSEVEEDALFEDIQKRRKKRALDNILGKPAFWAIGDTHVPRTFVKYHIRHMLLIRLFRHENIVHRKERKKRYLCDADRNKLMDRLTRKVGVAERRSAILTAMLVRKKGKKTEELQERVAVQNAEAQKMGKLLETLRNSPEIIPDSVLPELFRHEKVESQILLSTLLRNNVVAIPEDDEHRLLLAVALQFEHHERSTNAIQLGDDPPELTDPDAFHPALPSPLSFDDPVDLRTVILAVKSTMICRLQKEYEVEGYSAVRVPLLESENNTVDKAQSATSTTTTTSTSTSTSTPASTSTSTFASHAPIEGPLATLNTDINTDPASSFDALSDLEPAEGEIWQKDPLGFDVSPRRPFEWSHGLSQAMLTRSTTEEATGRNYSILTCMDRPSPSIESLFAARPLHPRTQKCLEPYRKPPAVLPPNFIFCSTIGVSTTGSKTQYDSQYICQIAALDGLNREFNVLTRPQFNYSELMRLTTYYMDNNFQRFWLSQITPSQGIMSFISWLFNPEFGRFRVNNLYVPKEARVSMGDEFLYLNLHDLEEFGDSIDSLIKISNGKTNTKHPAIVHYIPPPEKPLSSEKTAFDDTDVSMDMLLSFAKGRGRGINKVRALLAASGEMQADTMSEAKGGGQKDGKSEDAEEEELQEGDTSEYEWVEEGESDGENTDLGDGSHTTTTSTPVSVARVFFGTSYRNPFSNTKSYHHPLEVAAIVKQYQRLCAMDGVTAKRAEEEVPVKGKKSKPPRTSRKKMLQEEKEKQREKEEEENVVRTFTGIGSVGYCLSRCGRFTARQKRQQELLARLPLLPELDNGAVDAIYEEVVDIPDVVYQDNPDAHSIYSSTIVKMTNSTARTDDVTMSEAYLKSMFPIDMHEGAQHIALKADVETIQNYVPFRVPDLELARAKLKAHEPYNELLDMPARDPVFIFGYRIGFWTMAHLDCELRRIAMNAQRADYDELLRFFTDNHDRMEMLQECHPELAANAIRNLFIESGLFMIDLVEILRKYYDMHGPHNEHAWVLSNIHAQVTELDRPVLGQDALLHVHMLKEIFYAETDMGAFIRCEIDRCMNMARRTFVSTQKKNQFPKFPNLGRTTFVSHAEFMDYIQRVAELDLGQIQEDFLEETSRMAPGIPSIREVIEEKVAERGGEEYRAQLLADAVALEACTPSMTSSVEGRKRTPSHAAFDAINKLF